MEPDEEGFLYPEIDMEGCNNCGLCEKICQAINQNDKRMPLHVYAAKNIDENIRASSSSGGIFTLLAEKIINDGGVVFGARFNEKWEVIHDYTEIIDGLEVFRGSKYVQSVIGNSFKKVKIFLQENRRVLFSGTPCQIAGLKKYLGKNFENLFTIDLVCTGVPSPLVWKKYLMNIIEMPSSPYDMNTTSWWRKIKKINFRDKTYGWKAFGSMIEFSGYAALLDQQLSTNTLNEHKGRKRIGNTIYAFKYGEGKHSHGDIFVDGFLKDIYRRPVCHNCQTRSLKSGSDITLADYWEIQSLLPQFDDDKGVSMVLINTEKGKELYEKIIKEDMETTYNDAFVRNKNIEISEPANKKRALFFHEWQNKKMTNLIKKLTKIGIKRKFIILVIIILKKMKLFNKAKLILGR
jgi:coenzyme F420-reducing hydrogenase beta subunit